MKGKPSLCRDIPRARGDNGRETETENRIKENRGRGWGSHSPADAIIKKTLSYIFQRKCEYCSPVQMVLPQCCCCYGVL